MRLRLDNLIDLIEARVAVEPNLVTALVSYVENNRPLSVAAMTQLGTLLRSEKSFDVIHEHETPQRHVYRGMTVTQRWLRSRGIDSEKMGKQHVAFQLKATSWTISKKVAVRYFELTDEGSVDVILTAEVAANPLTFIAGPGGFYKLMPASRQTVDREVIAIVPVTVKSVEVIP